MKKKLNIIAAAFIIITVSVLIFSSAKQYKRLKTTKSIPATEEMVEINAKKNQLDLPFLESLTRHLLALGH
ncbi:MAG: hypothetical protein KF862_12435 [Chitinophagaceae bacterium]|nr:hypothetical protein [Chitinophagaceae bacterium]